MLLADIDARLRGEGLAPAPKEWTQFGFTPTLAAIECPWSVPGTTVTETYYAWAQLEPGQREVFTDLVLGNGYLIEESAAGTWVVVAPEGRGEGTRRDSEGAVLITDEWVAFADSRQTVNDIRWTR